jgi:hypothetical protein
MRSPNAGTDGVNSGGVFFNACQMLRVAGAVLVKYDSGGLLNATE